MDITATHNAHSFTATLQRPTQRVPIEVESSNEYCWRVRETRIPVLFRLGMRKFLVETVT